MKPSFYTGPETLLIQPASPADAAVLSVMIRELAVFEKLESSCTMTEETALAHLMGPGRFADALIASVGGKPAGFAIYFRTYSTFAAKPGIYLEDLFVREAFRGRGVGKELLYHVGAIARSSGCGRYEWTTLEWNKNARALYKKIGAREMPEWLHLRMEGSELEEFCTKDETSPREGCRCGGKNPGHGKCI